MTAVCGSISISFSHCLCTRQHLCCCLPRLASCLFSFLFPSSFPSLMSFSSPFLSSVPQSVSYDHVELNFFLNGKSLDCPVHSIRGSVYPTFYGELMGPYLRAHYVQSRPWWKGPWCMTSQYGALIWQHAYIGQTDREQIRSKI